MTIRPRLVKAMAGNPFQKYGNASTKPASTPGRDAVIQARVNRGNTKPMPHGVDKNRHTNPKDLVRKQAIEDRLKKHKKHNPFALQEQQSQGKPVKK